MYIYINVRVSPGVYAVLYKHGEGYAVTDYASSNTGVTYEFETRAQANTFREGLRSSH